MRLSLPCALVPLFLFLAGCINPDPKPAFDDMDRTVTERTGRPLRWMRDDAASREIAGEVAALLEHELTPQTAVAIALLNNRTLQAEFEEIGISQAELAQASRLHNPELTGKWRFPSQPPSGTNTEYSVAMNFLELLTLPARIKIAARELEQTKLRVANAVLDLAAETESAYYTCVANGQLAANQLVRVEIKALMEDIARRQHDAGNVPPFVPRDYEADHAQALLALAQARARVRADRERLNRLMGLTGAQTRWTAEDALPALPPGDPPLERLEQTAATQRFDLAAARSEAEAVVAALRLQQSTRLLPGITLGVETERETDGQNITGPFLGLEVPIFDQGQAAAAKLTAQQRQALRQYEALAVNIGSEVRDGCDSLLLARETAQLFRDKLIPQREQLMRETLLQYNAMQMSNYELLAARQNEQEARAGNIEAVRDYWLARVQLAHAIGGRLPDPARETLAATAESPGTTAMLEP